VILLDTYNKFYNKKGSNNKRLSIYFSKILLSIIFFLISIIYIKINPTNHDNYANLFFSDSISFARINSWYQKYFGSVVPITDVTEKNTEAVFSESLNYETMDNFLNGKILSVSNNYMVPTIESGVVVFMGEKEGYGNTLIIQGSDGVDIWYGNVITDNINLYDYIKKGTFIGPTKSTNLYLVFMKDNNFISYEEYFKNR
jgi:stage IV sporulation protein FA